MATKERLTFEIFKQRLAAGVYHGGNVVGTIRASKLSDADKKKALEYAANHFKTGAAVGPSLAKATPRKKHQKAVKIPQSASTFIRLHLDKSPDEIVRLGKQQGLKFSLGLVYSIRLQDRSTNPKTTKQWEPPAKPSTSMPRPKPRRKASKPKPKNSNTAQMEFPALINAKSAEADLMLPAAKFAFFITAILSKESVRSLFHSFLASAEHESYTLQDLLKLLRFPG